MKINHLKPSGLRVLLGVMILIGLIKMVSPLTIGQEPPFFDGVYIRNPVSNNASCFICNGSSGGNATSPAGVDRNIQFNNAGAFGAYSGFNFDSTNAYIDINDGSAYSAFGVRSGDVAFISGSNSFEVQQWGGVNPIFRADNIGYTRSYGNDIVDRYLVVGTSNNLGQATVNELNSYQSSLVIEPNFVLSGYGIDFIDYYDQSGGIGFLLNRNEPFNRQLLTGDSYSLYNGYTTTMFREVFYDQSGGSGDPNIPVLDGLKTVPIYEDSVGVPIAIGTNEPVIMGNFLQTISASFPDATLASYSGIQGKNIAGYFTNEDSSLFCTVADKTAGKALTCSGGADFGGNGVVNFNQAININAGGNYDTLVGTEVNATRFNSGGTARLNNVFINGNFTLSNTVWDDLTFPVANTKINPATSKPDEDVANIYYLFDDATTETIRGSGQSSHSQKNNTGLYCHVHWIQSATGNVNWSLNYSLSNLGATSQTWRLLTTTSNIFSWSSGNLEQLSYFPITAVNVTAPSAMFRFQLSRIGGATSDTMTGDAKFESFDCHYEKDKLGSDIEYR